ncbi:hypothetical protein A9Q84_14640 [Halobacteriovorax marinus]|uniref:Uncharacterized protein n=1 Tax=Halobacteriovorax marinus TaxID=97084 RepID=A0A1Y5FBF4_9BACT|nr:hypothetical protein A9Q84_14640 [Halobacteriovorax marinus]
MSLEPINEIVNLNLIELSIDEDLIISNFKDNLYSKKSLLNCYQMARRRKLSRTTSYLMHREHVAKNFSFLGEVIFELIESSGFEKLAMPVDALKHKTFKKVLIRIFKTQDIERFGKRVGQGVRKHGTVLLNNLYILSLFYDLTREIDVVLSLDHSREIPFNIIDNSNIRPNNLNWLIDIYDVRRVFKILLTYNDHDALDCIRFVEMIRSEFGYDNQRNIKTPIGKKPKSFKEIHNKLYKKALEVEAIRNAPKDLNQDIIFLEGKEVFEFIIQVPLLSTDLIKTGEILNHCVGTYSESVISKRCQIINLIDLVSRKPVFTIELVLRSIGYEIDQFKGDLNEDEYEGDEGRKYRNKILDLISEEMERDESSVEDE